MFNLPRVVSLIGLTALSIIILTFHPATLNAQEFTTVPTGYGPEDLVVDSLNIPPRILISCSGRRPEYPGYGEIQAFDPGVGTIHTMTRKNEPAGLLLRPHGISLAGSAAARFLYVISHDDDRKSHPVIKYRIAGNELWFEELLESPLLVSPNALQAWPDGSLLVCNDAAKRGSMIEKIFRLKRGNIIRYDGQGNWSKVASKLGMPAGLAGEGTQVYVNAALENRLYAFDYFDGRLFGKRTVCKVRGGDNIRFYKDLLITTSHPRPIRFILHVGNKSKPSPSVALRIDPRTGQSGILFEDDGSLISAASCVLIWENLLLAGQIFEPYLLIYQLK